MFFLRGHIAFPCCLARAQQSIQEKNEVLRLVEWAVLVLVPGVHSLHVSTNPYSVEVSAGTPPAS